MGREDATSPAFRCWKRWDEARKIVTAVETTGAIEGTAGGGTETEGTMSGTGAAVVGDATGLGLRDESAGDTTATAVVSGARRTGTVAAAARERCAVDMDYNTRV